ncbi:putative Trypanosome variant surface glycoprotein (A type) [Trypanosoma vivax]|nr:putative Trypanosome variant surface glycoprotein (A type) [Trypanosoma vivax]
MRERSATCAFLAACVLLALLGLRAHAAGKEPMEVNGAKLFCELSGTLKKVAKEIAAQLTARQGGVPKLSAVSLLLAHRRSRKRTVRGWQTRQSTACAQGSKTSRAHRARHSKWRHSRGTLNARRAQGQTRSTASCTSSPEHAAENYCIKAEDSTKSPTLRHRRAARVGCDRRLRMRSARHWRHVDDNRRRKAERMRSTQHRTRHRGRR